MSTSRFQKGDLVVLCARSWNPEIARHQGDIARIEDVVGPFREAPMLYDICFIASDKRVLAVQESALEPIDPISALGGIVR